MPGSYPLVALVILDGWGLAPPGPGNAVELADTPVFDKLWAEYPHTTIEASGEAVGLPPGQMGNSEVGHLTIGSGRVLFQDLMRVNKSIEDGSFFEDPVLKAAFERGEHVHLLGLVSHGGVHSHIDHLQALLRFAPEKTWIHAFTDGRDVSPHSAVHDLAELPQERIATVVGRYYAMDRDQRWDRTDKAFDAIVRGQGAQGTVPVAEVQRSYDAGVTDEFIEPVVFPDRPRLTPGDTAIFFNFRPDRGRQLTERLLASQFDVVTMTRYRQDFYCPVVFAEQDVHETMAEVCAEHGIRQLHVAETEKYAHVTYFFNGGREDEWEGETRILVPSPRDVPSYDFKPEMSAAQVADGARPRARRRRLRIRGREPRQPGHGRPHRVDPGGCESGGGGRRSPRNDPRRRRAGRRSRARHSGSRERGGDARPRGKSPNRSHHESRTTCRNRPRCVIADRGAVERSCTHDDFPARPCKTFTDVWPKSGGDDPLSGLYSRTFPACP